MTAAIIITSIVMADNVRISVPKGSPKRTARLSAWRTTAKADAKITPKSHARMRINHSGWARCAIQPVPNSRKSTVVMTLRRSTHSRHSGEVLLAAAAVAV
jgi:hypothetical protein